MLTEIGSIENVPDFVETVKAGTEATPRRASGTACTRTSTRGPRSSSSTADEVFEVTGKNPLLDIALKLEEVALADDYFTSRRLYPNVDFYSGLIYQAMGVPARDVHGPLRDPAYRGLARALTRSCSTRTRRSPARASSTSVPRSANFVPMDERV